MDFVNYEQYFQSILNGEITNAPYDSPAYMNYTKLNWTRQQRWLKTGEMNADLIKLVMQIKQPQHWIVITEPWCGDAAHILPFIHKLSQLNPLITLDIQLRDAAPYLIENYLTGANKSKSIPKLIVRNSEEQDLIIWGPRPQENQELFEQMKGDKRDMEEIKLLLQKWYNDDKGRTLQHELLEALTPVFAHMQ
ncbi:thioredoxin family protein [Chitinophaga ginsengisoli]|uniref:Thioredoxin-like protein n=1 Tax=Chitinophaga ginsengisoli TaxID=363837 RepID=A0A2P8GKK8_9BACT|nr:thioredoxin family protein [Chitinophaga ginsengisoli]PSL34492.1 thioredoxin-like protein [Chitinophaga ginsengisoli]